MSVASSELSPRTKTQGKTVRVETLYLDEIPGAMDKMGWKVSAAWSRDRCLSKAEIAAYMGLPFRLRSLTFAGFVPVRNADFRRWQNVRNEGGDFFVFSDIHWADPRINHVALP
ncbi:DUF6402 family protein [Cupriavidus agavae]|uniref:Uncharacterized protein n=1 Tax=Cupriavidus agavae TaxID=1001822 RepID=A0A4Q7RD50_9BURK|nr:DUF6402 family protein [Cupriavidus agavae]RZT29582.1 hypothetical protein EV147_4781 [Cupriavidus agavae]